jgi:hypothetical protein
MRNRPRRRRTGRRWRWCLGTPRRGHSRGRRRSSRGGKSEHQPWAVLGVAERDRPAVMDEDRRHAHAVDVHAGFTAIDGDPLVAVEVQDHQRRHAGSGITAELDVGAAADADRDVTAGGERVATRAEPDDQGDAERCHRQTRPPFSPKFSSRESIIQTGQGATEIGRAEAPAPSRRAGGATQSPPRPESAGQRRSARPVAARSRERDRPGPGSASAYLRR